MSKFDFKKDLPFGEEFEGELINRLQPKHTFYKASDGYFPNYDLICDCCGTTIECKSDRYTTGNMCFELPMLKKSKAKYLFYKVMGDIYWGTLEDVRYWIALGHELDFLKPQKCGERGNRGYIIPIEDTQIYLEKL